MESAVFMGKNYLNNCQAIANTTDLTLKQMFDMSTRLVSEQDEISGLETIGWENHSWKYLSLMDDERVINLQRTKVYVFSDSVLVRFSKTPKYLCRCSTTFPVDQKTMKKNAWRMPNSFLCMQRDLEKDNGHPLVLVLKRSGILWKRTVHKEYGTILLKGCYWNSQKADVQFSALRAHLSRGRLKSKGHGKLSIHYAADLETIETIFRMIISANQLSLYGAIAEICEEYETLHERTGRPVVMGQSSSSLVLKV